MVKLLKLASWAGAGVMPAAIARQNRTELRRKITPGLRIENPREFSYDRGAAFNGWISTPPSRHFLQHLAPRIVSGARSGSCLFAQKRGILGRPGCVQRRK